MLQRAASNVSDKAKNSKPKVGLIPYWCYERKRKKTQGVYYITVM